MVVVWCWRWCRGGGGAHTDLRVDDRLLVVMVVVEVVGVHLGVMVP